jgi:hypothetical protein
LVHAKPPAAVFRDCPGGNRESVDRVGRLMARHRLVHARDYCYRCEAKREGGERGTVLD